MLYVIAVKLLTHFSGAGNTGRHTRIPVRWARATYILYYDYYCILYGACIPLLPIPRPIRRAPIVDSRSSLLQETSRSPALQYNIIVCMMYELCVFTYLSEGVHHHCVVRIRAVVGGVTDVEATTIICN